MSGHVSSEERDNFMKSFYVLLQKITCASKRVATLDKATLVKLAKAAKKAESEAVKVSGLERTRYLQEVSRKIQKLQARLNPGPGGSSGIGIAASGGVTPRDGSTPRQAPLAAAGGAVGGSGVQRYSAQDLARKRMELRQHIPKVRQIQEWIKGKILAEQQSLQGRQPSAAEQNRLGGYKKVFGECHKFAATWSEGYDAEWAQTPHELQVKTVRAYFGWLNQILKNTIKRQPRPNQPNPARVTGPAGIVANGTNSSTVAQTTRPGNTTLGMRVQESAAVPSMPAGTAGATDSAAVAATLQRQVTPRMVLEPPPPLVVAASGGLVKQQSQAASTQHQQQMSPQPTSRSPQLPQPKTNTTAQASPPPVQQTNTDVATAVIPNITTKEDVLRALFTNSSGDTGGSATGACTIHRPLITMHD